MHDFILTLLEMTIAGNIAFLIVKGIRYFMGNDVSSILYYRLLKGCLFCYLTPAYFLRLLIVGQGRPFGLYDSHVRSYYWQYYGSILVFCFGVIFYIKRKRSLQKQYMENLNRTSYPCTHPELDCCMGEIKREYRVPKGVQIQVFINDCITSPMLAGVEQSAIYLPNIALSKEELKYVLAHEMVHYIQKDLRTARILHVLKTIFIFDFGVQMYFNEISNWVECSVEETMFRKSFDFSPKRYARVLQMFLNGERFQSCCQVVYINNRDLKGFKIRLEQMKHHKKRKKRAGIISSVALLCAIPLAMAIGVGITTKLAVYFETITFLS